MCYALPGEDALEASDHNDDVHLRRLRDINDSSFRVRTEKIFFIAMLRQSKAFLKTNINRALTAPDAGRVISHAYTIDLNSDQSTFFVLQPASLPLIQPTNTTLPTMQCVLDMGIPSLLANRTVDAALLSTVNPLEAVSFISL